MSDSPTQYESQDLDDLQLTQNLRRRAITEIVSKEGSFCDPEMLNVALSAAKSMDQQILTRQRIKADVKNAETARAVTDRIAQLLVQQNENRGKGDKAPSLKHAGIDDEDIAVVPGHTSIGAIDLDITDLAPNTEG